MASCNIRNSETIPFLSDKYVLFPRQKQNPFNQKNKQTNKQTIKQTNKQTNKQANKQTNKQTSKQSNKQSTSQLIKPTNQPTNQTPPRTLAIRINDICAANTCGGGQTCGAGVRCGWCVCAYVKPIRYVVCPGSHQL